MDPDPAQAPRRVRGAAGPGGGPEVGPPGARRPAPGPGPGGRWSRGSRVHCVPGREPCFFLPGTPRWRPGARGPEQTEGPGPEERGGGGRRGGGASSSPGGPVSGPAAPEAHQKATGTRKGPQGDGSRGSAPPNRGSRGTRRGNYAPQLRSGKGAGRPQSTLSPAAVRRRDREEQARAPRPLRPRPPQPGAPRPPTHRWRV